MQTIIYPDGQGGIAVVVPTPTCGISLEEIARKDVPAGIPYRLIDTADIPQDRTFRAAWTADFSSPDGHGIGAEAWFAEQELEREQELQRERELVQ